MEIKIQVDETQFKTLMEKTIADLPEEKLQEIFIEGLKSYFSDKEVLKQIFFRYHSNPNYYGERILEPTYRLSKLLEESFKRDDKLNEVADIMVKELRDNYGKLLEKTITNAILAGMANNEVFIDSVRKAVSDRY